MIRSTSEQTSAAPTKLHNTPDLSVIVAAGDVPRLAAMLDSYRASLDALPHTYEVICITDSADKDVVARLTTLAEDWGNLIVLAQRPWNGDDAALVTAIRRARGDLVLTLSGWPEVMPEDLGALFEAMTPDVDMVVADRGAAAQGGLQGLRRSALGRMLKGLFGQSLSDPFCRVRLARRAVLEEVGDFGVRQHFLPVIAAQRGYLVTEAALRPAEADREDAKYVFKPLGHLRALFDAMALFVVLKFLRRPLRFFGSIGLPIFLIGAIATFALVMFRLFGDMALADRPALIFAVLMVVLGVQIIAIGLVGEIIIFANAKRIKQYAVRSVIRQSPEAAPDTSSDTAPGTAPDIAPEQTDDTDKKAAAQ